MKYQPHLKTPYTQDETGDILIPASGDFTAWEKTSDYCLAVDWDGTCKDTMVPKWTQGFNLALTEIWPALKPHQDVVDDVCYKVNMLEDTAGVQRFVALMIMMRRWAGMGLPVPGLAAFFRAVEAAEERGDQHGVATYQSLQAEFGYDDSPLRWSERSDELIEEAVKDADVFPNCREVLENAAHGMDLVVVSASKTEAVRNDLLRENMTHLFKALCAQDFLPKKGILEGLAARYDRILFIGDTKHDIEAAETAGVPIFLVRTGDEAASWQEAAAIIGQFVNSTEGSCSSADE